MQKLDFILFASLFFFLFFFFFQSILFLELELGISGRSQVTLSHDHTHDGKQ